MVTRVIFPLAAMLALLLLPTSLAAQVGPVIRGRIEDASSRQPIAGARVLSADSSVAVLTDSTGTFAIQLPAGSPLALHVDQFGYLIERFDLPDEAPLRLSVLLLQPDPVELPGIEVVGETQVEALLSSLQRRRNAYPYGVSAFDRGTLERFAPAGSAWDFVRRQVPFLFECDIGRSGVCLRLPRNFQSDVAAVPSWIDSIDAPEIGVQVQSPIRVCIDGWETTSAIGDLQGLDIQSVALVEIYRRGLGGIRIYTPGFLVGSRRSIVLAPSFDLTVDGQNVAPTGGC